MPKVGKKDPHLKSPLPKILLILAIVGILVVFVAPKVLDIYNDNLKQTDNRASKA